MRDRDRVVQRRKAIPRRWPGEQLARFGAFLALGRDVGLIAVATFLFNFGVSLQTGVFTNFMVEDLHLLPAQVGFVEAARELPGLLTVALAAVTWRLAEPRLAGLCLAVTGLGVALQGLVRGFWPLVGVILLMSSGMHLFFPPQTSLVLHRSRPDRKAASIAAIDSLWPVAVLVSTLVVFPLARFRSFQAVFILCGVVIAAAAAPFFLLQPAEEQRRSFVLRRHYGPFYWLTFFSGARRPITAFARLALVSLCGLSASAIVVLYGLGSLLSVAMRLAMEPIIKRFGERRVLLFNYVSLVVLYLAYAFGRNVLLLSVVFLIDQLMFSFEVARPTYLDKVADPKDVTATVSAGVTLSHVASFTVPLVGGILWQKLGPEFTFGGGALLALVFAVMSFNIKLGPVPPPKARQMEPRSVEE